MNKFSGNSALINYEMVGKLLILHSNNMYFFQKPPFKLFTESGRIGCYSVVEYAFTVIRLEGENVEFWQVDVWVKSDWTMCEPRDVHFFFHVGI